MSRETLRARLEAATPGPWGRFTDGHEHIDDIAQCLFDSLAATESSAGCQMTDATWVDGGERLVAFIGNGPRQTHNGDLIAHARQDLPALLALADAAEWHRSQHQRTRSWEGCVVCHALAAVEALP